MLSFHYPERFWALLLVPVLLLLFGAYRKWQKDRLRRLADAPLQQALWTDKRPPRRSSFLPFLLSLLALTALVVAATGPYTPKGGQERPAKGVDVMMVLDASRSMRARDVQPDRLSRATSFVSRLADKLTGDRIGLIVFAGRPYLQVPLTTDRGAFKLALQSVTPEALPTQGTILSAALNMATGSFSQNLRRSKVLVLVTDGEDHDQGAPAAAAAAREAGIRLIALGVGTPQGIALLEADGSPKTGPNGEQVISRLGEAGLQKITEDAGGTYLRLQDAVANADEVAAYIRTLPATYLPGGEEASAREYFPLFAALALVLLLLQRAAQSFALRRARGAALAGLLLLLLTGSARAQSGWQEGNRLYREGKFAEAAAAYRKALSDTASRAAAQYNLGNALYKKGDFAGALKAYEEAAQLRKDPDAAYNTGNSYAAQKQWKQAMEAYQEALRAQPGAADAQRNYAYARKQLQRQQQEAQQKQQQRQEERQPQEDPNAKEKLNPSGLSKEQAEKMLQALRQEEQKINDRKKETEGAPTPPEKDW